tara:strand:- start:1591 stop:2622 length:1032 start_codon:yes stop_codon:yes gene_type:complete
MRFFEFKEAKQDIGYDNWDHPQPADYSKHLEKTFGAPDEITNEQTVWHHKDGFKRIVVRDEYILHGSPAPHYDFVYSYIDLEVPEDLSDELAKCSGSILIDHLKNEVGARCGSLTANAVTLNFCMDVVAGRIEPVKENYEKAILKMKDMFTNNEHFKLGWWPDETGDADPANPYYKEGSVEEDYDPEWGHETFGHVVKHKDDNGKPYWAVYNNGTKDGSGVGKGQIVKVFYSEKSASDYADKYHDELMRDKIKANEDLRAWFGKGKKGGAGGGGWDRYNTKGERIGKCGDRKPGEGKPKCLSKSRAASLRAKGGKEAIARAVNRKRRKDPNKNRKGKAKNVKN